LTAGGIRKALLGSRLRRRRAWPAARSDPQRHRRLPLLTSDIPKGEIPVVLGQNGQPISAGAEDQAVSSAGGQIGVALDLAEHQEFHGHVAKLSTEVGL